MFSSRESPLWRSTGEYLRKRSRRLTAPITARAGPTLDEADRLRNVARTPAESAEHEDRLTGFERETGLLGDSGHRPLVALDPATENDPRLNVTAHDGSHGRQSLCPLVLVRFVHGKLQPFFPREARVVRPEKDEAGGRLVFDKEGCKLIRRHPDMHRPS